LPLEPKAIIQRNAAQLTANRVTFHEHLLVEIFTAFGRKISELKWNHRNGRLMYIGWSHDEQLLCICETGDVYAYSLFGVLQSSFNVGAKRRIVDCRLTTRKRDTFLVLADEAGVLYGVQDIHQPIVLHFPDLPRQADLTAPNVSWEIYFASSLSVALCIGPEVFLISSGSNTSSPIRHMFQSAFQRITRLVFDYNFDKVCFFTDTGHLNVAKINEINMTRICEFHTKSLVEPNQLMWAGEHAVCALWNNILLCVGFDNDWFSHVLDEQHAFHLIGEVDGVRVIGDTAHELIERIPDVVVSVFKIGSEAAGALLLEAHKEFQKKTHRANEYMRILCDKAEHELAVRQCIEAAGFEFKASNQKMLLRAAAYGKCFVPTGSITAAFTRMCQRLRVLNAIRRLDVALPVTNVQFEEQRVPTLIERLVRRREYLLAIKVCEYLKVDRKGGVLRVLNDWAQYKVKQFEYGDAALADQIARKLTSHPEISFCDIAQQSLDCNRKDLALQLLEFDSDSNQQVPLLLKLQKRDEAMLKAIESGDSNLVYSVILSPQMLQSTTANHFKLLKRFPVAYQLYLNYLKQKDLATLKEFHVLDNNHFEQALLCIREACSKQSDLYEFRHIPLGNALDLFRKGKHEFEATATEEHVRLFKHQQKLEEKFRPQKYVGLSVQQTLRQLILDKMFKPADELRKEFKVTDKRYWWLKVITLAEQGEWFELEKFSNQKKSPIGYEASTNTSTVCSFT
jgi:hypothetical protein